MKNDKKQSKTCANCDHCLYIGESDSMCDVNHAVVLADWKPTDEFLWCDGKDWTEN